jgi:hypothetical protein
MPTLYFDGQAAATSAGAAVICLHAEQSLGHRTYGAEKCNMLNLLPPQHTAGQAILL